MRNRRISYNFFNIYLTKATNAGYVNPIKPITKIKK